MSTLTLAQFTAMVGQPIATSKWVLVDQAMIDTFADVTEDHSQITSSSGFDAGRGVRKQRSRPTLQPWPATSSSPKTRPTSATCW